MARFRRTSSLAWILGESTSLGQNQGARYPTMMRFCEGQTYEFAEGDTQWAYAVTGR